MLALSCSSDGAGPAGVPASIQLDRRTLDLFTTEAGVLRATVRDAKGGVLSSAVSWRSADPAVARVDSLGRVTGVSVGSALIEAQAGEPSAQATVTVKATLGFALPLRGQLNQDFFYTNYVDLQAGTGIRDFQCGLKTYDGHTGTDIVLPSFARMDQGVDVLAAASGTITVAQDGLPDRNKSWTPGGGFANHVVIQHRDGFRSIYGHMKRNSIRVSVGQQVQAGTLLGQVGSSGTSDMPHLHIEFQLNGAPVEMHAGTCGANFTHWAAPPPYQNQFRLIQTGLARSDLTVDLAKDPPAQVDTFSTNDARIYLWVHLHNVRAGSVSRFQLVAPSGAESALGSLTHNEFYSMSWWWFWQTIPGQLVQPGTWRARYFNDNQQLAERAFVLKQSIAANRITAQPGAPFSGVGGGGLQRVQR